MEKKSKILLWGFFILLAVSVGLTFYRVMIKKDYLINMEVACDPTVEKCFQRLCDPESEECANADNPEMIYYKILEKNYKNIKPCAEGEEDCQNLTCEPDEKDCREILCDENALGEGGECANLEAEPTESGLDSEQAEPTPDQEGVGPEQTGLSQEGLGE